MSILNTIKQDEASRKDEEMRTRARSLLQSLVQPGQYVGDVYSLGYEKAFVQIHDHHRRRVGGIPSLCFLVAARQSDWPEDTDHKREDSSVILLRVMDAAALPGHAEAERVRVELAQKVSGDNENWDESKVMDATTHYLLSFAGVSCRVIGTFFVDATQADRLDLRFGSDLSNYYPNQGLKVFKPNDAALKAIVNYVDPDRSDSELGELRVEIGEVRYASTNRSFQGVSNVSVTITPVDLLGQKTALFGMTRSGKSNTTKIILQSVFQLRFDTKTSKQIGQIVFDPNGEYANENAQDPDGNSAPSAIKNVWKTSKSGLKADVVTYGITPHKNDPDRRLMLLNFFDSANLPTGKQIIDVLLSDLDAQYIKNFVQISFDEPETTDKSAVIRFDRKVLAYRALLKKAGLEPSKTVAASTKSRLGKTMFNEKLIEHMKQTSEPDFQSAAVIFEKPSPTWDELSIAFEQLSKFMATDEYSAFENWYVSKRPNASGNKWADADLGKILKIFEYPNGARQIGKAKPQHSPNVKEDYAEEIYKELVAGKLVIIDQSSGEPELNRSSSERIMWRIFRGQQDRFRKGDVVLPEILAYIEEAHNLLPAGSDMDLQDVWVRTAKEGAKYHIGMVYATQEVSSIQKNILKNTANWFIGHLNNTDETKELCKYYDFEDFEPSIRRAQDRGFLRIKTLSNLFVVPVQVKRFLLVDAGGSK